VNGLIKQNADESIEGTEHGLHKRLQEFEEKWLT
jgi:hypothetical protein